MQAIIRKELREHFRWAMLAMLAIGAYNAYLIYDTGANYFDGGMIASLPLQTATTAILAALGLATGQALSEAKPGLRSFLIHRPLAPATIFWAKCLSGLALYVAATGIPFVLSHWWLAVPGHLAAPFDWHFMLSGVADNALGALVYFAALITAWRRAGWYGSRVFPILAVLVAGVATGVCRDFGLFVLVFAELLAVFALAARANFITAGEYRTQAPLGRAVTGLVVGMGLLCVTTIVFVLIDEFYLPQHKPTSPRYPYQEYEPMPGLGLVHSSYGPGNQRTAMVDLAGKPVPEKFWKGLDRVRSHGPARLISAGDNPWAYYDSFRSAFRIYHAMRRTDDGITWFYDRERDVAVGYDHDSKTIAGYLDSSGLVPIQDGKPARPLKPLPRSTSPEPWYYASTDLLCGSNALYEFDITKKRVRLILTAQPGELFRGAGRGSFLFDQPALKAIYVLTNREIKAIDENGKLLVAAPVPNRGPEYVNLAVRPLPDPRHFFVYHTLTNVLTGDAAKNATTWIDEVTQDGRIARSVRLSTPRTDAYQPQVWYGSLDLIAPPVGVAALGAYCAERHPATFHKELSRNPRPYMVLLWLMLLSTGIATVLAHLTARRCAFGARQRWAWTIGVLLTGPVGLFTLWALHGWPARERCAGCGRLRVVTRNHCEHCGAAWPVAPKNGTELFEAGEPRLVELNA